MSGSATHYENISFHAALFDLATLVLMPLVGYILFARLHITTYIHAKNYLFGAGPSKLNHPDQTNIVADKQTHTHTRRKTPLHRYRGDIDFSTLYDKNDRVNVL